MIVESSENAKINPKIKLARAITTVLLTPPPGRPPGDSNTRPRAKWTWVYSTQTMWHMYADRQFEGNTALLRVKQGGTYLFFIFG